MSSGSVMITHEGGCHCGRVKFEVDAPADLELSDCNCSVCTMTGYLHLIVRKDRFRVTSGRDELSVYTFNSGVAQHYFCRHCGIKSYYIPRSNPDGVDVNGRCISPDKIASITIEKFDGRNWEDNAASLAHLTQ